MKTPNTPSPTMLPWNQAALVVAMAVVMRIVYWYLFSRTPYFYTPVVDASFFDIWARSIVAGQEFQPDVYFKPPLYPYLLAFMYRVFGPALVPVYLVQNALGVAGSLLILMIGRLVFTPRIALTGALVAALLPMLPFFELQLLAETVTTFLSLLALWLMLLAIRDPAAPRLGLVAGAGLLLGLAALGRPNLLLLPPFLALWLWLGNHAAMANRSRRRRWLPAVVLVLGALLAILPTSLRNLRVGGSLVPVCANLGVNLWTGHHPGADGISAVPVGVKWDDLQLRCQQAGAGSAVASSRLLAGEATAYMTQHPNQTLAITLKKALVMVGAQEVRNNIGADFLAEQFGIFLLQRWWPGFWLLGPFAILGLVYAGRWGWRGQLLWLYVATLFLAVLPFFANARFRLPLLPVLALWGVAGLDVLIVAWHQRHRSPAGRMVFWRSVVVLVLAFVLVNVNWYGLNRPTQNARDHFYLATILAKGFGDQPPDSEAARQHFRRAESLNPQDPDFPERHGQQLLSLALPYDRRAQFYREGGQWPAALVASDSVASYVSLALPLHGRAIQLFPRSYRSYANTGTAHLWLGDGQATRTQLALAAEDTALAVQAAVTALDEYATAGRAFQQALAIWRTFPEAAANLQICAGRIGDLPPLTPEIAAYQRRLEQSRLDIP